MDIHHPAGLGHNSGGPASLADLLDPDILTAQMEADDAAIFARLKALQASDKVMRAKLGDEGVTADATAARISDLAGQIKDLAKKMEDRRVVVKEPFATAVSAIDRLWKTNGSDVLKALRADIERKYLTPYLTRKAAEERRIAQEEAERRAAEAEQRRIEAEQATALAERTLHPELLEQAASAGIAAEGAALVAHNAGKYATASDTELSRTRGAGSMASLRIGWGYRLTNFEEVPRSFLELSPEKIKAAIRAGARDIPGLEIYQDNKAIVR